MSSVVGVWEPTQIDGLEVLKGNSGTVAIRLWGWEGVLPLSLIRSTTSTAPTADTCPVAQGSVDRE